MTEEELEGKLGKIPKERRLKYMKRETPEEINRKMKEGGLVDIDEPDGLVPLIIPTDGTAVPNQYIARLRPGCEYEESWHARGFSSPADDQGHGTHVASTVGGATYGVAKEVNLIPVKVCDENGASLNDAVNAVLDVGIPVAISAGNHNPSDPNDETDSCNASPASVEGALTVGATDEDDFLADFSFFGKCVDIYAPGSKIMAADFLDIHGSTEKSGTSMAAPLVAGAIAGMLQVFRDAGYFTAPSQDVVDNINHYIIEFAEKGTVLGLRALNNNNVMLQTPCLYTV
ncbi:uncharacterized protein LOC106150806 [Lingula anatina]|uniref:Uncharacterized protein LOC106150806 n=1 Tax=Lingula anatina TaxID=7574 RepID=A0A1S3H199_LINAN|nr:uncharacterized protein LOC106150806 [Lingula anatina]|eukprot:XP_013379256.1 uncharacterized protein LOC106150806 [Lingula anatina]